MEGAIRFIVELLLCCEEYKAPCDGWERNSTVRARLVLFLLVRARWVKLPKRHCSSENCKHEQHENANKSHFQHLPWIVMSEHDKCDEQHD